MRSRLACYALTALLAICQARCLAAQDKVGFNRQIRPILASKCFQCHGPDEAARQADLRLDVVFGAESPFAARDGSQVIQPGDLQASLLWQRLTTRDEDQAMPPKDSQEQPLTPEQLELFERWILQGADYETHWAFAPPTRPASPAIRNSIWTRNRIDQFVLARLEPSGLLPQPPADKRTLVRRVTFDLTGLPPTVEQIRSFVDDPSEDAYPRLVDRLLATPQYGEHMAKFWLDLVRFADTNGIHHDHYREMTPYRDWVIHAFNDNLRFDKFIVDQLAGDLHDQPSRDEQIASGFNRLHLVIDKGTALPEESFTRNVIDRVTSVGTAFMGLTVGCAVCHDHKYDPLTQKEFYQLFAFFNNIDAGPETPGRDIHAPFIRLPDPVDRERLRELELSIASTEATLQELKSALEKEELKAAVPANEADAKQSIASSATAQLPLAEERLKELVQAKNELESSIPVSLVMRERMEVRPTYILIRGAYDQPGAEVQRDTPAFLPPMDAQGPVKTRMDLARWLTDGKHPLTARVTVNRFWQQFFGVGLVKTSEDFGIQGEWPSHPQLLDELATSFVDSQWDVKQLVRSIVCSETYQQAAGAPSESFRADPRNRLLARGSRFRLDAEMIRDQILATSGLLNSTMYGKSVKPPQPPGLWKSVSMVSSSTYSFTADTGDKIYRRSLYSFWKRAMPPPQMTIFDAPSRESCIARRERTNTPLQALVLMNEEQYFKAAKHFARQLLEAADRTDQQRLSDAYESITSQLPDPAELSSLCDGLATLRLTYQQDLASARALTSDDVELNDQQRIEIAAHTMLINALFNLDVVKTRD